MTLTTLQSRVAYVASGGEPFVPVPFPVQRTGDLLVYRTPSGGSATLLTYGTHYSMTGVGDSTGQIGLVTPAVAGDVYDLIRVIQALQELNLRNQGGYLPETLEKAGLDRIVMMIQSAYDILSPTDPTLARALLLNPTDVIGDGAYNALSNRIENVEDGTAAQDVVTLAQMQAAIAGVVGGGGGLTRILVTAAGLPVAGVAYDYAATGIEYIVRDTNFPDVVKRCLRLSTGNTYDWFVVVQGDR